MASPPRSIEHRLTYSMLPIWLGAMVMLLIVIGLAPVPAAKRIEEQRIKEHLQRVIQAIQADINSADAFTRDWGLWDDSYQFILRRDRGYIEANLQNEMPMRDFGLNLMSYMDANGNEIWTRTFLPDSPVVDLSQFPYFLDELKQQLVKQSIQQGWSHLHGIRGSQWGPIMFSWQPISDSKQVAAPQGFLLVVRWLDQRYLAQLSERTALHLTISLPSPSDVFWTFKPLQPHMLYRLVDTGLQRIRGEGLLLNNNGAPVLTISVEEERRVLLGVMEGALWTFIGMLVISVLYMLVARYRLRTIVLGPLYQLVEALQQFGDTPDARLLPLIDSSLEMAMLSRNFREMATKISEHHNALVAHSSHMELVAYTDPLTRCFNRRYLDNWLLGRMMEAQSWSLMILDLDHFKLVNDRYGHDIGDVVLCQLAELLRNLTGEKEPVIRLGGEEFLVLICGADEPEIVRRVEQLRMQVAACRFGREDHPLWLTASLGYCVYPLAASHKDTFWSLSFKLADMALYQAKQSGRNRWCGYSGALPATAASLTPEQLIDEGYLTVRVSGNESDLLGG